MFFDSWTLEWILTISINTFDNLIHLNLFHFHFPYSSGQESVLEVENLINKISADNNFKWRAYFKQCTVEDFSTPEMAKRNIELGKKEIETHQKKIKILQQQNRRLKCRVARLKQLLKQCKQNNTVDIGNILDEDDEVDYWN